jgi:hypothetical protein
MLHSRHPAWAVVFYVYACWMVVALVPRVFQALKILKTLLHSLLKSALAKGSHWETSAQASHRMSTVIYPYQH